MPWGFDWDLPSNIAIDHLLWTRAIEQRKMFTSSNFSVTFRCSVEDWNWRFPLLIQSPSLVSEDHHVCLSISTSYTLITDLLRRSSVSLSNIYGARKAVIVDKTLQDWSNCASLISHSTFTDFLVFFSWRSTKIKYSCSGWLSEKNSVHSW